MFAALLTLLLVIANVTGAGMVLPQVVRLHRHRGVDGVSIVWLAVGVALNIWWTVYSVSQELWGILPVSIGSAVLYSISSLLYFRIDGLRSIRRFMLALTLVLCAPLLVFSFANWGGVGLALGLAYSIQFSPAVVSAFSSGKVGGISATTWLLALTEAAIWCFYGLVVEDIALVVGGAGGSIASLAILLRLGTLDRRARQLL